MMNIFNIWQMAARPSMHVAAGVSRRSGSSVEDLVEALDQSKSKRQGQSDLESEKEKKQVCAVRACSD